MQGSDAYEAQQLKVGAAARREGGGGGVRAGKGGGRWMEGGCPACCCGGQLTAGTVRPDLGSQAACSCSAPGNPVPARLRHSGLTTPRMGIGTAWLALWSLPHARPQDAFLQQLLAERVQQEQRALSGRAAAGAAAAQAPGAASNAYEGDGSAPPAPPAASSAEQPVDTVEQVSRWAGCSIGILMCTYTCTYTCTCILIYTCTCTCIYLYVLVLVYTCTCILVLKLVLMGPSY